MKGRSQMFIPTIIMAVIAITLTVIAYLKGDGTHIVGAKAAYKMGLGILPLLIFAFITAAMVTQLLPKDLLTKWVGAESGFRGIMIGTLAGAITPGGPYVSMPIAAGLLKGGAGVGTMVAFLTSWSLWAVARLPMDIGIMGWHFTAIRLASVIFFPPLAGVFANIISRFFPIA